MPHDYRTIRAAVRAPERKIKGSRFIAELVPVSSVEEATTILERIRSEWYDASHHCFAYRIGELAERIRAADDGEPKSTAGTPILLALTNARLTNVMCVVTRYFGGTLLGTGGLARAYSDAAQSAIALAEIVTVYATCKLRCQLAYEDLGALERLLPTYEAVIARAEYGERVNMIIEVRVNNVEPLRLSLIDRLNGRVLIQPD